ncbi:MAG: methionine biosynthesis protein MetW [Alphaproteobacteria bacterium]
MTGSSNRRPHLRPDLRHVADLVPQGARVLDIGCGDGQLLETLWREKGVDGRGVELSMAGVNACVTRGLSVIQGNADTDLADYPDASFDVVVLSQTLQAVGRPRRVLEQMLRIGRRAIVSFPNFGHWSARVELALRGRVPGSTLIDQPWYRTPSIHPCSIADFVELCRRSGITIERGWVVHAGGAVAPLGRCANVLAREAVFLLNRPPA